MSIHVQYAPHKLAAATDWARTRDQLADHVVRTLERYAPGFSSSIDHRQVLTPADLEERYGLTNGHIHHGELALDQLFTMRPILGYAQYRTPIEGLFLCGAGTHPGGGVSGLSGRNAAREILRSLKR
jgi:phytoene dehydrogenase-like protein